MQSIPNAIHVQWDGLEHAVKICSEQLLKGSGLELQPQFHKVLVYKSGDFFTWHRDHKDQDNLFATLSVNVNIGGKYKRRNL
jgi:hypothetical protein